MPEDAKYLHIPNAYNSIQSALYQLSIGKIELAIQFLENSQSSLTKANPDMFKTQLPE
jgi:hypothetical protein